jgi:hypothetical protein
MNDPERLDFNNATPGRVSSVPLAGLPQVGQRIGVNFIGLSPIGVWPSRAFVHYRLISGRFRECKVLAISNHRL